MGFTSNQLGNGGVVPTDTGVTLAGFSESSPQPKKMRQTAVQVKNACKTYGKGPPILENLNMTVPRGTIYGLLGASGCGKTTMLACIVGLRKLDAGEVWVYGAKPGTKESGIPGKTVGYMPQDIALYEKFTIKEILSYFGRIYGMSKSEISARLEFLASFLDLPDSSRLVGSLSGGQQRRASLAVAMIHQPALLILDEPTVGVDPLIRENIWQYLCEMVNRGRTTVIITTHYIEEARQADTVGLMRNGRLLVESEPQTLLDEHNADLLEDIVLKLCKNDLGYNKSYQAGHDVVKDAINDMSFYSKKKNQFHRDDKINEVTVVGLKYKTRSPDDETVSTQNSRRRQSVIETVQDGFSRQLDKVYSVVIRNFLTYFRHPMFVIVLLILPTIQVVLFNLIIGSDPLNTHVGVVNNEFETTDYLNSGNTCKTQEKQCFNDGLSCNFLSKFGNQINWDPASSEEEAMANVRSGDSRGFMIVPSNFTEYMKDRSLSRNYVSNETLDGSTFTLHLDFSDHLMSSFLVNQLFQHYLEFVQSVISDCDGDPRVAELPLKYTAIYGSVNSGSLEYMQPPQILLIMFLLPMAVSVTYIWDKKAGTLDRTCVAGVDFIHVIVAWIISEGVMMILELIICFSVLIFVFNFTVQGSMFLVFLLSLLMGICGLSFGFLYGTLCDNEIEAIVWILGTYMPTLIASGSTWPREGMHPVAKFITEFLPVTLPSEAIRSIVSRGWGISHPNVWPGFVVIIGWTTVCCFLSGVIHRVRT